MDIVLNGITRENLKKVTTLFIDIDGTLLNSKHELPKNVRDSLMKLKKHCRVILCTGRYFAGTICFHRDLGLDSYMSCLNGGVVYFNDEKIARQINLSKDVNKRVVSILKRFPCVVNTYSDYGWSVNERNNKFSDYEVEILHIEPQIIHSYKEILDCQTTKFLFLGEPSTLDSIQSAVIEELPELKYVRVKKDYLEVYDKRSDKGGGVRFIMDQLNLNSEECLAMGDAENDIAMFKEVAIKVKMGNGPSYMDEHCNVIIPRHDDEGAALLFNLLYEILENK